jgi:glucose/arabinose dehydrogenase
MKKIIVVLSLFSLFLSIPTKSFAKDNIQLDKIKLPPGFEISIYATGLPNARSMALSPNGTLFVGSRDAGNVYAVLPDKTIITIAKGLYMPNGVTFHNGSLYVAEVNKVLRYDDIEAHLYDIPKPTIIYAKFPNNLWHGWKYIRFGPDNKLYIPVGMPCNVCEAGAPYGSLWRMNPDGTGLELYAKGIRNTVGFDWDPLTKELWFTDNGRDMMGDDIPPDELNHAPDKGMNFGFPYCHGKNIHEPKYGNKHDCSEFTPPEVELGPHVAALGMRFYTGKMFPPEYQNQIFIAEHGSWNRSTPIGYRITLVKLDKNRKAISYETFAQGWLQGSSSWGRPVDILIMPDGSMLVSDDKADAIYQIKYTGKGK